ncbi:MAG: MFS transporter [Acidobacteriota bacterium]
MKPARAISEAPSWQENFFILWTGQFLVTAGLTVVVPLLPFYLEQLGTQSTKTNRFWSGFSLAAPAITLACCSPFWGRLGDRVGRKWMVVRALFGIAGSVTLMGLALTPGQFLIARLLQGTFGGIDDAAAAFTSTQAPASNRGKAIGRLQTATAAGAMVGPLIGGFLSDRFGFRPLFLITGALIAVSGLCAAVRLREVKLTRRENDALTPMCTEVTNLIRQRQVITFILGGLFAQLGNYGIVIVFATHVRELLAEPKYAASWVGTLQAVTLAATLIGAAWWGKRNDCYPIRNNFLFAAAGCAISIALQALPIHIGWLFPLRILQGFCMSAISQSVYLQVSRDALSHRQGVRIGVANSFLTLGQVIGSLLGGALAAFVSPAWIFVLMGSSYGLTTLLVWFSGTAAERTADLQLERGKT